MIIQNHSQTILYFQQFFLSFAEGRETYLTSIKLLGISLNIVYCPQFLHHLLPDTHADKVSITQTGVHDPPRHRLRETENEHLSDSTSD